MHIKIKKYLKKRYFYILLKNNLDFVKINYYISLDYFYFLSNIIYEYNVNGLCIKKKRKESSISSFTLFFLCKNIKVHQLFLLNNPFIILMKKKNSFKKKKLYFL